MSHRNPLRLVRLYNQAIRTYFCWHASRYTEPVVAVPVTHLLDLLSTRLPPYGSRASMARLCAKDESEHWRTGR